MVKVVNIAPGYVIGLSISGLNTYIGMLSILKLYMKNVFISKEFNIAYFRVRTDL